MRVSIICSLAILTASCAFAHSGDRVFPIVQLSDADLSLIDIHDGSIEDWQVVVGDPQLTPDDFNIRALISHDFSDLDYRVWMAWHQTTNRIYVAVEKIDDRYVVNLTREHATSDPQFPWYSDSGLNFLIDGDHGGGQTLYDAADIPNSAERIFEQNKESQFFMAMGEDLRLDGRQIALMPGRLAYDVDWFVSPPYAEAGGGISGENPTVMVTEFYVTPFDKLVWSDAGETDVSDLQVGQTVGFAIFIIDYDTADAAAYQSVHHIPHHRWGVSIPAEEFSDGILLDLQRPEPSSTAVENRNWARIKTALRLRE